MRWLALAVLLALPAALAAVAPEGSGPPVAIQATAAADRTLYVHVHRGGDFPITPGAPDPSFALDYEVGLATSSLSCVPDGTPVDGLTQHQYTTFYAYAALGPARYPEAAEPGSPLRAGLAADLRLDAARPLTLHWFLSTPFPAGDAGAPLPLPGVALRATVRLGERVSPFDVAYNQGAVVAAGETPPTTLAGPATTPTPGLGAQATAGASIRYAGEVGGLPVYEATVPMPAQVATIPQDAGFNLRVDIFQRLPACPDPSRGYVMANAVSVHTSDGYRPRLEARELEPLRLQADLEQFVDAQVLHIRATSPWGATDVDGANATVDASPAPASFLPAATAPVPPGPDGDLRPLEQTWVWNTTVRPGSYTVRYAVASQGRAASAEAAVTFQVGARSTPGVGAATALALLVGAAAVRRRR